MFPLLHVKISLLFLFTLFLLLSFFSFLHRYFIASLKRKGAKISEKKKKKEREKQKENLSRQHNSFWWWPSKNRAQDYFINKKIVHNSWVWIAESVAGGYLLIGERCKSQIFIGNGTWVRKVVSLMSIFMSFWRIIFLQQPLMKCIDKQGMLSRSFSK